MSAEDIRSRKMVDRDVDENENEHGRLSSSRWPSSHGESSLTNGGRHDRVPRGEHRERRSRPHRDHEDRHKERSNRRRDDESSRSRSQRHRSGVEDRHRSESGSKRHRDDDERGERKHRQHYDDSHRRRSKDSSIRREKGEPSPKLHSSSDRRDRDERASRDRSFRDHTDRARRDSRSRSPKLTASTSAHRPSPPLRRSPSFVAPSLSTAAEEEADDAPNFAPSGLLAAESNTVNGVALKYHEPPEARKPKSPWRLYCFKDGKEQEVLRLASQSAYLLGRDRTVVDIPLDHESCSKQHAVLQFRQTITTNEFGDKKKRIQPYLIDLESSNGSYVNDTEIPTSRYYQLRTGDTLTFGASTREYVLLDESSS